VVVARGLSLVSAAQSSDDAGFGELDFDGLQPARGDAGVDEADAAAGKPSDPGHSGPGRKPPGAPFFPPPRTGDHDDPRDKEPDTDPADGAADEDRKAEKVEKTSAPAIAADAGQARDLTHHDQ
jgi:hypothetical protein